MTVSRRLRDRLTAHSPAAKTLISKKKQKSRLAFIKQHVIWSDDEWSQVFLTWWEVMAGSTWDDIKETNCSLSVWRRPLSWRRKCDGVGNVFCSWCLTLGQVAGQCKRYSVQKCCWAECGPCNEDIDNSWVNNAPCMWPVTRLKLSRHFALCSFENIQLMSWRAQSPDLNPIENPYEIIGDKVREKHPTTVKICGRKSRKNGWKLHRNCVGEIVLILWS